jgi:hypothetical protein
MNPVIYSDSAEYQRIQRERRIHETPSVQGASAVHVVFAAQAHIVDRGKLSASMAEARRLVHQLMEQFDTDNPTLTSRHHATLQPLTAQQVRTMQSAGAQVLDAAQLQAYCDLIVQTCYGAIRDCDESQVRVQAAHVLHTLGFIPRSMS